MICLCQKHHVDICFVSTPYYYTLNAVLEGWRLDLLYSVTKKIEQKYGVTYYDFRSETDFERNPCYFKDDHHMSIPGANKLTMILKERLGL